MKNHRRIAPLIRTCVVAGALCIVSEASEAAPITLNLQGRLARSCELVGTAVECTPQDVRGIPITVTYDPDTITVNDLGFGWQMFVPSASVTLPFAPLPDPFPGPATLASGGSAFFSNNGAGRPEYREGAIVTGESFIEDVCRPDGICGYNSWGASAGIGDYRLGTPAFLSAPTAADFEALLLDGTFSFETLVRRYDADANLVRLTEYQSYTGNVPEPPAIVLLGVAASAAASRATARRRVRTGTVARVDVSPGCSSAT
jgi:hypothetical protein